MNWSCMISSPKTLYWPTNMLPPAIIDAKRNVVSISKCVNITGTVIPQC